MCIVCYAHIYLTIVRQDADELEQTITSLRAIEAILTYICTPYPGANSPSLGEVVSFSETNVTDL
jgi:predicted aconitase